MFVTLNLNRHQLNVSKIDEISQRLRSDRVTGGKK